MATMVHYIFIVFYHNLKNKILKKIGALSLPNFETDYKTTVINVVCYWLMDKQISKTEWRVQEKKSHI